MWWIIQMPLHEPTTMFRVIKKLHKWTFSTDMEKKTVVWPYQFCSNPSAVNCSSLLQNVYKVLLKNNSIKAKLPINSWRVSHFLNREFYKEACDNFPDLETLCWDYFHKLASSNNSTHLVMKQELWFLSIVNSSKTAQSVLSEASVFRGKWPTWGCLSSGRLLYCMERIFSSLSQGTPLC